MKWYRVVLAIVVGVMLLIALVGLLLPKWHRATRMARFKQPPEAIFAAITGPQNWRGVSRYVLPPDGGPKKYRDQSGRWLITYEEIASDPPKLYRAKIVDEDLPFAGTWTWEITPTDDGCTCRITEVGEVKNPAIRVVSRFLIGYTKSIDTYRKALCEKFNEPVHIQNYQPPLKNSKRTQRGCVKS